MNDSIEKLPLSKVTRNALLRHGINTLSDILKASKEELLSISYIGPQRLAEIESVVHRTGLKMSYPDDITKRGRPKCANRRDLLVRVRLTSAEKVALAAIAKSHNTTVSEYVRQCIFDQTPGLHTFSDIPAQPIEYLDITEREYNCLKHNGYFTIQDVLEIPSFKFLLSTPGLVHRSYAEDIVNKIHDLGLKMAWEV